MHRNNDYGNRLDMPLGISMAVAQNPYLLKMFMSLSPQQRESLVSDSRGRADGVGIYKTGGLADGSYNNGASPLLKPFV